jgi:predicted nucleic acid-binding protein
MPRSSQPRGPSPPIRHPSSTLSRPTQTYLPLLRPLLDRVDRGELEIVTSTLTLTEVLVKPFSRAVPELASQYVAILAGKLVPVSETIAKRAAQLRAVYPRLKTPDAIQLATAIEVRADVFLTNDFALSGISEIRVVTLDSPREPTEAARN